MNKLDTTSPVLTLSSASHSDLEPACRLIVLCSASEAEPSKLSNQILEIAHSLHLNVLLFSLSNHYAEESQLRRKLIIMSAIIKDANVSTEIMIEHGKDWVKQVKKILRTGDVVACYSNQKTGLFRKPLEQVLRSNLSTPVYILSDGKPN
ncbi:MAG: hypothetical protein HZB50_12675 [Chloroflexi bacterium]|nr:hypothetical protein [Chloroflexota bacterium]